MLEPFLFWSFVLLAVPASLGVVFAPNMVYSAVSLLVVFLGIAGFFMLNGADFLAVAQIMVYAVGLTIVLLFGLMFTGDKVPPMLRSTPTKLLLGGTALAAFVVTLMATVLPQLPTLEKLLAAPATSKDFMAQSSIYGLGLLLFNKYVLPFEVVSLLLLAAMIGAIVLSKKSLEVSGESAGGLFFEPSAGRPSKALETWQHELDSQEVDESQPTQEEDRLLVGARK
jgi:NADH:ubiquinone oxidoreductase subunit 6 (subunit J)